jgi:hypothetical protein
MGSSNSANERAGCSISVLSGGDAANAEEPLRRASAEAPPKRLIRVLSKLCPSLLLREQTHNEDAAQRVPIAHGGSAIGRTAEMALMVFAGLNPRIKSRIKSGNGFSGPTKGLIALLIE